MKKYVLGIIFLFLIGTVNATSCIDISRINSTYEVTEDIKLCPGTYFFDNSGKNMIEVKANKITIDCKGATLQGLSVPSEPAPYAGIYNIYSDVQIENCNIHGFYTGIYSEGTNNIIEKNELTRNTHYGLFLIRAHDAIVKKNKLSNNGFRGAIIESSNRAEISENLAKNNPQYGIQVELGDAIIISDNIIINSGKYGLYALRSKNLLIEKNKVINSGEIGIFLSRVADSKIIKNIVTRPNNYAEIWCNNNYFG